MTGCFYKNISQRKVQEFKVLHDIYLNDVFRRLVKHERKNAIIRTYKVVFFIAHGKVFGMVIINSVDTNQVHGILREIMEAVFKYKCGLLYIKGRYAVGNVNNIYCRQ